MKKEKRKKLNSCLPIITEETAAKVESQVYLKISSFTLMLLFLSSRYEFCASSSLFKYFFLLYTFSLSLLPHLTENENASARNISSFFYIFICSFVPRAWVSLSFRHVCEAIRPVSTLGESRVNLIDPRLFGWMLGYVNCALTRRIEFYWVWNLMTA